MTAGFPACRTPHPRLLYGRAMSPLCLRAFFTVTNQGAGAAGPFTVTVTGEGSFAIPGLAAGASATRTFRTICKNGAQEAFADALAQIAETDETNNKRTYNGICIT